jgi:predicted nucleic acid-binding protein
VTQLADTNVLAELVRRRPDRGVAAWAEKTHRIAISVITIEEISYGLAWRSNQRIQSWFDGFVDRHCDVLPVTEAVARRSGWMRGELRGRGRNRTQADMLIAATAQVHGLTLVTRNARDFEGCGIPVLDPFA